MLKLKQIHFTALIRKSFKVTVLAVSIGVGHFSFSKVPLDTYTENGGFSSVAKVSTYANFLTAQTSYQGRAHVTQSYSSGLNPFGGTFPSAYQSLQNHLGSPSGALGAPWPLDIVNDSDCPSFVTPTNQDVVNDEYTLTEFKGKPLPSVPGAPLREESCLVVSLNRDSFLPSAPTGSPRCVAYLSIARACWQYNR